MVKGKSVTIKDAQDEPLTFKYSITSYGADFDVEGLVKRIEREDIYIPPFQRKFVWTHHQASRFIESLLLGLPVPGIFLSKEQDSQRLLVIDGQQRLWSLFTFYNGIFVPKKKEFALTGLHSNFEGLTFNTLSREDKRRLDDSIIHATIVRQDEPDDGDSSIYMIFERLNTGGNQLQAQEIRSALYHGEFNDLLAVLNKNQSWRNLFGALNPRKRDEELILRFFALYYNFDQYQTPIKEFLNNFMGSNRHLKKHSAKKLTSLFERTVSTVEDCFGSKAFKPKSSLNAGVYDSVMLGVARRLTQGPIEDKKNIKAAYTKLLSNQEYVDATEVSMADVSKVNTRVGLATQAFASVK